MYIGSARDPSDVEVALLLATNVFNNTKEISKRSIEDKKNLVSPYGSLQQEDVVIVTNNQNEICGTCILIDREMYRGDLRLRATFLSAICISESYQGQGLSRLLMEEAIKICEERGSSFAVLIARKAVDYFYNKFFFWGISEYSTTKFKIPDIPHSVSNYSVSPVTYNDLAAVGGIYDSVYSKLLGSFVRSEKYWDYVLWKAEFQQFNFLIFRSEGKALGYVISHGDSIYEIAATSNSSSLDLLLIMKERYSLDLVTLHCSGQHPINYEIGTLDFSCSRRQCYFGGHMVRILDSDFLLNCIKAQITQSISELGISNHMEVNCKSEITIREGSSNIDMFGSPLDYENTCFLMGADQLSISSGRGDIYKRESFNIPYFDQI